MFTMEYFTHISKLKNFKWDKKEIKGFLEYFNDKKGNHIWNYAKQGRGLGCDETFKNEKLLSTFSKTKKLSEVEESYSAAEK